MAGIMKAMESPLKMFTSDEAKLAGRWEMVYQVYADDTVVKNGVSGTSKHLMGEGATGSRHMYPSMKAPWPVHRLLAHCPPVVSCAQSSVPPLGSFDRQFVYVTGAPSAHAHSLVWAQLDESAHVGPW